MKKVGVLITLVLIFISSTYGQCPSGDLVISSQAEIDAFTTNFPDCNDLEGNLTISGSDITDLSPLGDFLSIMGTLKIENNPLLVDFTPSGNLTVSANMIQILDNAQLESVTGLELDGIGQVIVENNPNIINLTLGTGGGGGGVGTLVARNNENLQFVGGHSIDFDPFNYVIENNPSFTSFHTSACALGSLQFINNDALVVISNS